MTPYHNRLTGITKRMAEDMLVRNLSANTIDAYTYHVDRFVDFAGRPAEELGPEEIRQFQLYLIRDKKVGWSSFNQAVCGLRFLYRFTLPRPWHVEMIPFGKRPKKLPLVLGQDDLVTAVRAGLRAQTSTPRQAVPQVQSTLAKLSLCRTAALGGRKWRCQSCDHQVIVYNSCGDRHCPGCRGAKRAEWLGKTEQLLLPQVNYFQVVFTLPDLLSPLLLGNRRVTYALLMRTAWQALQEVLQDEQGIEPAAALVLHTWNQELDHHPHVHPAERFY